MNRFLLILSIVILAVLMLPVQALAKESAADQIAKLFTQAEKEFAVFDQDPKTLDRAINLYEQALAIDPENSEALWRIAQCWCNKAELASDKKTRIAAFEESLKWANKALDAGTNSAEAHFYVGCGMAALAEYASPLQAMSMINTAKEELATTMELDKGGPYSPLAKLVLASIYIQAPWPVGDKDKALELALQGKAERPSLTLAHLTLGQVYAARGEDILAQKALQDCLAIRNPEFPPEARALNWPSANKLMQSLKGS